ncbi:DHH family phosphoesterase, partial [Desulfovibrio sp. OttesenSCG-928-F07]|nr:DHH family phosphoesterase [Desulfovibrio sp. OttesenSCG-928-F07]
MTTTNTTPTTIITAHVNADFDALASMVAAKTLYPEAVIVAPPYREKTGINYFLDSIAYVFNFKQPKDLDLSQVNKLVVVDTRQKSRIKHVEEVFANPGLKIHVYDHHPDSADDVIADFSLVKTIGATTTIIAQLMQQQGITPSPD